MGQGIALPYSLPNNRALRTLKPGTLKPLFAS